MQQACTSKLSKLCLQLQSVAVPASSVRQHTVHTSSFVRCRASATLCVAKASSAHLSHDTASSQQATVAEQPFQPLTKARKKKKQPLASMTAAVPGSGWQKAGKVAGYSALAVGAGLAVTALAVDIADVALASAALYAGRRLETCCCSIILCSCIFLSMHICWYTNQ